MYRNRISGLRHQFPQLGVEAILVSNPVNVLYLSGFHGTSGWLVITGSQQFLITDFRYIDQAKEQAPEWEIARREGSMPATLKEVLSGAAVRSIGFESEFVTYKNYLEFKKELQDTELIPLSGVVEKLRIYKDPQETEAIRGAVCIADKAFSHMVGFIKPGISEQELAAELECFMRKNGADKPSFDTIVASGFRGAMPHGTPSKKAVEKGDFVVMDFGAVSDYYCSDITRTVVVGSASPEQRKIYEIVLEAQTAARKAVRPGIKCSELDAVARNIIAGYGYGENFGHGLGHGVGLDIHENPAVNMRSEVELAAGMVVTIEPGIYLTGWGGVRIEDMVLVTETGSQVLTQSGKELIEIT